MGLNLDVDHVAFASDRKFDGYQFRRLTPAEFAQVAGRAGRATRNGTFGTTGPLRPVRARARERAPEPHLRSREDAAMAQYEAGFLLPRRAPGLAEPGPRPRDPDAGADRRGHARARPRRPRRRGARYRAWQASRGTAVGGLPGPGLQKAVAGRPCRAGDDALRLPDAEGLHPRFLVRGPNRPGRQCERRYRHAVGSDRADPHLDLRRQPPGLAERPRTLAGDRPRGRK
ncbi:hypothetical protein LINPERHAP1_LOCUS43547 [Linum perenne]